MGKGDAVMARSWRWIGEGWELTIAHWPAFGLLTMAFFLALSLAHQVAGGGLVLLLLGPAQMAALVVALHYSRTGRFDWDGLREVGPAFLPAVLVGLLVLTLFLVGWLLFVIPGLVVLALYLFPMLLLVDRKLSCWQAMEESRLKAQQDTMGFVGFALALLWLNLLGVACFGIGLALSLPVSWCATVVAYRELWAEGTVPAPTEQPRLANEIHPTAA